MIERCEIYVHSLAGLSHDAKSDQDFLEQLILRKTFARDAASATDFANRKMIAESLISSNSHAHWVADSQFAWDIPCTDNAWAEYSVHHYHLHHSKSCIYQMPNLCNALYMAFRFYASY